MASLEQRMAEMVSHYQAEMPGDPLSIEDAVEDAERFLCDGTGGSCVSLMKRLLLFVALVDAVLADHGPPLEADDCDDCDTCRALIGLGFPPRPTPPKEEA